MEGNSDEGIRIFVDGLCFEICNRILQLLLEVVIIFNIIRFILLRFIIIIIIILALDLIVNIKRGIKIELLHGDDEHVPLHLHLLPLLSLILLLELLVFIVQRNIKLQRDVDVCDLLLVLLGLMLEGL